MVNDWKQVYDQKNEMNVSSFPNPTTIDIISNTHTPNNTSLQKALPQNALPTKPATPSQEAGKAPSKALPEKIRYMGVTRKVHADRHKKKYIRYDNDRVYLADIRGKYRYVR